MKYRCSRLVATHLPTELYDSINEIADSELLSRSQVIRDAIWSYIVSRQEPDTVNVRSTRQRLVQNSRLWDDMFSGRPTAKPVP